VVLTRWRSDFAGNPAADARARRHFCREISRVNGARNSAVRSRLKLGRQRTCKRSIGVGGAAKKFFRVQAKFIRLLLDNACDRLHEKNLKIFSAAHRYPQKRWKTSG